MLRINGVLIMIKVITNASEEGYKLGAPCASGNVLNGGCNGVQSPTAGT